MRAEEDAKKSHWDDPDELLSGYVKTQQVSTILVGCLLLLGGLFGC